MEFGSSFNIQGRGPYFCGFVNKQKNKQKNSGMYSDIFRLISFKLGMIIKTTRVYMLVSVWMTWTFILGHSCMRNQKFCVHFLGNFTVDLDESQYVASAQEIC